jgi:polyribonucleotide nucleotidyltransferase
MKKIKRLIRKKETKQKEMKKIKRLIRKKETKQKEMKKIKRLIRKKETKQKEMKEKIKAKILYNDLGKYWVLNAGDRGFLIIRKVEKSQPIELVAIFFNAVEALEYVQKKEEEEPF